MVGEIEEKKEFLGREEIKTMQKDIERLREKEAQKERERVAAFKTEEEEKREGALRIKEEEEKRRLEEEKQKEEEERKKKEKERKIKEEEAQKEREEIVRVRKEAERKRAEEAKRAEEEERRKFLEKVQFQKEPLPPPEPVKPEPVKKVEVLPPPPSAKVFRPLPAKPSLAEKILVRFFLLIITFTGLAMVFTFWYWYFKVREVKPKPTPPPAPIEKVIPPRKEISEKPEISIPLSLIPVDAIKTLEFSTPEQVSGLFSQVLGGDLGEDRLTRILLNDLGKNKTLGLKEFFEVFKIKTPENFFSKLGNDFTLFVYSTEKRNRLGFVVKIKEKTGLMNLLKSWEPTMTRDFENLYNLFVKKEKPAFYPQFKERNYKGITFYYSTLFPEPDYVGVCYGLVEDFFIFSSSCHNTLKLIDFLKKE